jgi:hypothetical protein
MHLLLQHSQLELSQHLLLKQIPSLEWEVWAVSQVWVAWVVSQVWAEWVACQADLVEWEEWEVECHQVA